MIKQKNTGELIIISGTTCAGKGSVIHKLLENHNDILLSTSYTSRPKRENEKDGVVILKLREDVWRRNYRS